MAIYKLLRISNKETFQEECRDREHALAVFGRRLGATLSLDGPAAPDFMMGRIGGSVEWGKLLEYPVFIVRAQAESEP